jgi:sec-independent protein translocase protein TatB
MFGIGIPELLLILIVALLVVGPSRLPQVARAIGKALGDFRRMADDVKETIEHELINDEEKPDESQASRVEPQDTKDAAALHEPTSPQGADASSLHEPLPPHENGAISHGGPEPAAEQEDPYARKGS